MLVLYETAMGYCLFKMTDAGKLDDANLYEDFEDAAKAKKLCVLPDYLLLKRIYKHAPLPD